MSVKCDWNDLHVARGLDAVRAQIGEALDSANDANLPQAPSPNSAVLEFTLDGVLKRFALVVGTTMAFDLEENRLLKPAALSQLVGKSLFKEWKEKGAGEGKRFIDDSSARRRSELAEAEGVDTGDMTPFERYVLIHGTQEVWDDLRRRRIPAKALQLALGDFFKTWQNSSARRDVYPEQIIFDPSMRVDPQTHINTFEGLPLTPLRAPEKCAAVRETLLFLCNGSEEAAEWLTKWMAYPLQHMGAKMATAVLAHSTMEGSGKSFLFSDIHRQIYGPYGATVGQHEMEASFNEWQKEKLYAVFEEVVSRDQRYNQMGKIKHQITGKTKMINAKFMSSWEEANLMNAVFLSNEIIPFPVSENDRRMLVLWPREKMSEDLRVRMKHECDTDGAAAWLGYLLDYPLGEFNEHTQPPMTPAKERLIDIGRSSWEHFLIDWMTGQICNESGVVLPFDACLSKDLYQVYRSWCETNHMKSIGAPVFSQMLSTKLTLTQRCHWTFGVHRGQTSVFLPSPPPSQDKARAIGERIAAFRSIAVELKVGDSKWGQSGLLK